MRPELVRLDLKTPKKSSTVAIGALLPTAQREYLMPVFESTPAITLAQEPTAAPTPSLTPMVGPLFPPGSIVRVLADTSPSVRPIQAEGILVASISSYAGNGIYLVSEYGSTRTR
jgi:hypothetical protein